MTVNGESSSIPGGAFSWKTTVEAKSLEWREDEKTVYFRGAHDGFARFGVGYERELLLKKHGSLVLTDSIKCASSNSYEINFILSPDIDAEIKNDSVTIFDKKKIEQILLTIYTEIAAEKNGGESSWKIEKCSISPGYGLKIESKKLVFTARLTGNFKIRNIFDPTNAGVPNPQIENKFIKQSENSEV